MEPRPHRVDCTLAAHRRRQGSQRTPARGRGVMTADVAPRTTGPPLSGRRVRLRSVVPTDYDYLYRLANHQVVAPNWRYRGPSPSPGQFAHDLWAGTLVHFMAVRKVNGQRFGYVQAFD